MKCNLTYFIIVFNLTYKRPNFRGREERFGIKEKKEKRIDKRITMFRGKGKGKIVTGHGKS